MLESKENFSFSEERVKLALRNLNDLKSEKMKFVSFITIMLSFLIPIFTADFKSIAFLDAKFIYGVFVTLSIVFFSLALISGFKYLILKNRGIGSDEWFMCEIKGQKFMKNNKSTVLFEDLDFKSILYYIILVIYWIIPILVLIFIYSMVGWSIAWSRTIAQSGDLPQWVPTSIFSIMGLFMMYSGLYWLYDNFIAEFLEDKFDIC